MTDSMTRTIDDSPDWEESEAHELRPGSQFRIPGDLAENYHDSEIFTVIDIYKVPTFGTSELSIVTNSRAFDFKDFDTVLVIPSHEQTIAAKGAINDQ